jgi:hypothetical protein
MAISLDKFNQIRNELGWHTSWAVWSPVGDTPKSNVGDLSIFDDKNIESTLEKLNPDIILVGLNGSTGGSVETAPPPRNEKFANFHSTYSRATDFKIRYATLGTALEGAFMTDVIKHHYETDSNKMVKTLRNDREYEKEKVREFFSEIATISRSPTIFAFGGVAYDLIAKYNEEDFKLYRLYHYAFTMSKEIFREETLKTLKLAGLA